MCFDIRYYNVINNLKLQSNRFAFVMRLYSTIIYQNQNVLLKYKNAYGLNGMIREHDNIENAMLSFLTIT